MRCLSALLIKCLTNSIFLEQKVFCKKNPIINLYFDCCNLLNCWMKPALFGNPIFSLCKLHKVFQGWETCFPLHTPRPWNTNSSPRTCVALGFLQPRHLQRLPSWWSPHGVSLLSQTENCTQMLETSFSLKREAKESAGIFKEYFSHLLFHIPPWAPWLHSSPRILQTPSSHLWTYDVSIRNH